MDGVGKNTNRILDELGHHTGLLGPEDHAETGALGPSMGQVLAEAKREKGHVGQPLAETMADAALDRLVEHTPKTLAGAAAVLGPLYFAYKATRDVHHDWQVGQAARRAAFNDAASFAVTGALDFPPGFKTEEHARHPHVERAGLALTEALLAQPSHVKLLQARADAGFLDAERAFAAVTRRPVHEQRAAVLAQLGLAGKGYDLEHDLAYGKGVESFLFCRLEPSLAQRESLKVHERAGGTHHAHVYTRG